MNLSAGLPGGQASINPTLTCNKTEGKLARHMPCGSPADADAASPTLQTRRQHATGSWVLQPAPAGQAALPAAPWLSVLQPRSFPHPALPATAAIPRSPSRNSSRPSSPPILVLPFLRPSLEASWRCSSLSGSCPPSACSSKRSQRPSWTHGHEREPLAAGGLSSSAAPYSLRG